MANGSVDAATWNAIDQNDKIRWARVSLLVTIDVLNTFSLSGTFTSTTLILISSSLILFMAIAVKLNVGLLVMARGAAVGKHWHHSVCDAPEEGPPTVTEASDELKPPNTIDGEFDKTVHTEEHDENIRANHVAGVGIAVSGITRSLSPPPSQRPMSPPWPSLLRRPSSWLESSTVPI